MSNKNIFCITACCMLLPAISYFMLNMRDLFVSLFDFFIRVTSNSNIKPQASSEILRLGSNDAGLNVVNASSLPDQKRKLDEPVKPFLPGKDSSENDPGNLTLKLGGSSYSYADDTNASRQNKRVRSGSPGSSYPMCQVDDCRTDLTSAKDYHRRHKVCETHSKASKALVGSLMQRFCQQCSRWVKFVVIVLQLFENFNLLLCFRFTFENEL
jgi:hypothetical protein